MCTKVNETFKAGSINITSVLNKKKKLYITKYNLSTKPDSQLGYPYAPFLCSQKSVDTWTSHSYDGYQFQNHGYIKMMELHSSLKAFHQILERGCVKVRSGQWCWDVEEDPVPVLHPKMFSGIEVRALCWTLKFFHFHLNTPRLPL